MKREALDIEATAYGYRNEPGKRLDAGVPRQDFEDPKMDHQLDLNLSHDDDDTADHARLERLFSRRAQKADTYHRISLTTRPRPTVSSHPAS